MGKHILIINIMPTKDEIKTIIEQAFKLYDEDQSGFLEFEEIKKLMNDACGELGAPAITDEQLKSVIEAVDENGDGKFSLDELSKIIEPILTEQLNPKQS